MSDSISFTPSIPAPSTGGDSGTDGTGGSITGTDIAQFFGFGPVQGIHLTVPPPPVYSTYQYKQASDKVAQFTTGNIVAFNAGLTPIQLQEVNYYVTQHGLNNPANINSLQVQGLQQFLLGIGAFPVTGSGEIPRPSPRVFSGGTPTAPPAQATPITSGSTQVPASTGPSGAGSAPITTPSPVSIPPPISPPIGPGVQQEIDDIKNTPTPQTAASPGIGSKILGALGAAASAIGGAILDTLKKIATAALSTIGKIIGGTLGNAIATALDPGTNQFRNYLLIGGALVAAYMVLA